MPNPPILPIPPAVAAQVNAAVAASHRLNLLTTATISWNQAKIIWILSDQQEKAPPELREQIAQAQAALDAWQQEAQAQWPDPNPDQEPLRCWPITPACNRMACGRSAMENGYAGNPNFVTCPQCLPNLGAGQPGYVDNRSRFGVAAAQELARALAAAPRSRPAAKESAAASAAAAVPATRPPELLLPAA